MPRTLPRQFHLSPQNTSAHINLRTSSAYSLLHFSTLTCSILLERHNLPLCPLRVDRLGDRSITKAWSHSHSQERLIPPSWHSALATCCESSRKIIDLAQTCQEWNVLVETPCVTFALYLAAFTSIYCVYFPWLMPERPNAHQAHSDPVEDVRIAMNLLDGIRARLPLATNLVKTLWKLCGYLDQMRHDLERSGAIHETNHIIQQALKDETSLQDRDRLTSFILRFSRFEDEEDQDKSESVISSRHSIDRRASVRPASDFGSPEAMRSSINGHGHRQSFDSNTAAGAVLRPEDRWSAINNNGAGSNNNQQIPAQNQQQSSQPQGSFRSYSGSYDAPSTMSSQQQHPYRSAVPEERTSQSASGWTTSNSHPPVSYTHLTLPTKRIV